MFFLCYDGEGLVRPGQVVHIRNGKERGLILRSFSHIYMKLIQESPFSALPQSWIQWICWFEQSQS